MHGEQVKIVALNAVHITLATVIPIYSKELYRLVPYPLLLTFLEVVLSVPPALFVAWIAMGRRNLRYWIMPPRSVIGSLVFSSVAFGLMMGAQNLGIYVSDINLATLFKLSGIVWQGILAKMYLGEAVTLVSAIATAVVMVGTFFIAAKFEWSTDKLPSAWQMVIHALAIAFQSVYCVSIKKVLNGLRDEGHELPVLVVLAWRYVLALAPLLVMSLVMEWRAWEKGFDIFDAKSFGMTVFGAALGELFQVTGITIAHKLSVLANAICGQLKHIPTLFVSHVMYRETKWTWTQITGTILLCIGTFMFTISRMDHPNGETSEETASPEETLEIIGDTEEDTPESEEAVPHEN